MNDKTPDESESSSPASSDGETPSRPRRRWRRWLLGALVVLVVVSVVGHGYVESRVQDELVRYFESEELEVELGGVDLGWTGGATLSGLVLRGDGETLASLEQCDVAVGVTSLLGSNPRVSVTAADVSLLARRDDAGVRLAIVDWLEEHGEPAAPADPPEPTEPAPESPGPVWTIDYALTNAALVVEREGTTTDLLRTDLSGEFSTGGGGVDESAPIVTLDASFEYPVEAIAGDWGDRLTIVDEGGDRRTLTVKVSGPITGDTTLAMLSNLTASGTTELPVLVVDGVALRGPLSFELKDGVLASNGDLRANDGDVPVELHVDLSEEPTARSHFKLDFSSVTIDRDATRLLRNVHPLFAMTDTVREAGIEGALAGLFNGNVEIIVEGPIDQVDVTKLSGRGRLEVRELTAIGSKVLRQVLDAFDIESPESLDLNAIEFQLDRGRLGYTKPVALDIDGYQTLWQGSIGLDGTVDMRWELPISDAMKKKTPALRYVPGGKVALPVGGTVSSPTVDIKGALSGLGAGNIGNTVKETVLDAAKTEGGSLLGDFLGTGADNDEAAALLKRADALYDAGKKNEAKPLYQELRAKYRKTATYRTHKNRIKSRD